SAGAASNWDGGASGLQANIGTGGYLQGKVGQTNTLFIYGLSNTQFNNTPVNNNWQHIQYAIYFNNGSIEIRESGSASQFTLGGGYTTSDVFQVRVNSANRVEYVKNGVVFY